MEIFLIYEIAFKLYVWIIYVDIAFQNRMGSTKV
jgi:hypothetical protein